MRSTLKCLLASNQRAASIFVMFVLFLIGCGVPTSAELSSLPGEVASPEEDSAVESKELPVSEEEAMAIAMEGLDPSIYATTSTISGPLKEDSDVIVYEVTVNGGDHLYLRYVDAETSELFVEMDARHEIPSPDDLEIPEGAHGAYYTSCPAGWPLCLRTPSSITFYSQRDPNWINDILGYGPDTIGQSGCLLSSYAMQLCYTGYGCRTPKTLNANKSYFSGPYVSSSSLASTYGASYSTIGTSSVWSTIASGIPVVAYGYSTCRGSNHAQMLWGHDGSRYWTKDPWYDWSNQDQSMCVNSPSYRVMR